MNFADKVIFESIAEHVPLQSVHAAKAGMKMWQRPIPGAISSAIAKTLTAPLDLVKILIQTSKGAEKLGIMEVFSKVVKERGFFGLWTGNGAAITRIAPQDSIKYFIIESLQDRVAALPVSNTLKGFILGTIGGEIAQMLTYPLEVARTKMSISPEYTSIPQTISKIVKEEGFGSLYSGVSCTILGAIPYHGGSQAIKAFLRKSRGTRKPGAYEVGDGTKDCA